MAEEDENVGGSGGGAVATTSTGPFFGVEETGKTNGFATGLLAIGFDSKWTVFCLDCLADDWPPSSTVGAGLLWFGMNTCTADAAASGGSGGGSCSMATEATSVGRDKGGSDAAENNRKERRNERLIKYVLFQRKCLWIYTIIIDGSIPCPK